jgi:hypothetical protein
MLCLELFSLALLGQKMDLIYYSSSIFAFIMHLHQDGTVNFSQLPLLEYVLAPTSHGLQVTVKTALIGTVIYQPNKLTTALNRTTEKTTEKEGK